MKDIQQFIRYGVDREIPELWDPSGIEINLGPGRKKIIPNAIGVGKGPQVASKNEWWAPEPLPFDSGSVAVVHAYQFMEHLDADTAIAVLREVERVLVSGGVMNIATPYPGHAHYWQALDHKTAWTEETWDWLFGNDYYDDHEGEGWRLKVHVCFLGGVVYRNLNMFTQLVKE